MKPRRTAARKRRDAIAVAAPGSIGPMITDGMLAKDEEPAPDGPGPNAVIIGDEVMNEDEEVVNNDERRALVSLKREVELAQTVVEEALHQLIRQIDARISATGERRRYHPQPESWPLRPPSFKK